MPTLDDRLPPSNSWIVQALEECSLGATDETFWSDYSLIPIAFVPLNLDVSFSRWFDELAAELSFEGCLGIGWGSITDLQVSGATEVRPDPNFALPNLICIPGHQDTQEEGLICCLKDSVPDLALAASRWLSVLEKTLVRLRGDVPYHFWTAVIGPDPDAGPWAMGHQATLSAIGQVGTMILVPSEDYLEESRPHPTDISFYSSIHLATWPVYVSGSTRAHNRSNCLRPVAADLSVLSALMSLLFGTAWKIREMPNFAQESWPRFPELDPERRFPRDDPYLQQKSGVALPQWVEHGWELVHTNPVLNAALFTYYESLRLAGSHPSYSLIAVMSCLQTIGSCHETRSSKQLRAGLLQSVDAEKADRLIKFYDQRSKTAHQGLLFGREKVSGVFPMNLSPFNIDPTLLFEWTVLWELHQAAREALIKQF
jgi:hypothetical protein